MKHLRRFLSIIYFFYVIMSHSLCALYENENMYKDVPVLVTGGCGFIGSHLVEKLVKLGADVYILDDLSTGTKNNIAHLEERVTYIHGSVTDFDTCLQASHNKKVIFHLAAIASVPGSTENPYKCHFINITGIYNILEAARRNNVQRVVFSSSCAVYGETETICTEDGSVSPISPYGFSKLVGELACAEYARVYDVEVAILRYFNVYGSRQDPRSTYSGVITKFSHNMERNMPITICGDGMQTRDFVPVEKVVSANLLCGMCTKELVQGEIFNIATGSSITLLELVEMLKKKYTDYAGEIFFAPSRPGDVKYIVADTSKFDALYDSFYQR